MEQRTGVKGDQPVKGIVGDSTIETGAGESKVTERTRAVQLEPVKMSQKGAVILIDSTSYCSPRVLQQYTAF